MICVVVNKHVVRANLSKSAEERQPPFRCSRGKHGAPWYLWEITGINNARLVYDVEHPMPCGASVWLEIPNDEDTD